MNRDKQFRPCTRIAKIITLIFLSAVFALSISAATLADYRKRIEAASTSIDGLIQIYNAGDESAEGAIEYRRDLINEARDSIPEIERIEFQGNSVETSNRWLKIKLDEFEKESDAVKQKQILTDIYERLSAISQKSSELENPTATGRSKDEDKQKLAEILRREEYQKPQEKEESLFQRWWRKFTEWLESIFPRPKIPEGSPAGFQGLSFILQIIVYAVVIALVGFLIYKFAPSIASRFRRRERQEKIDRVIFGERIEAHESAETLFDEAERMAREGNLRGAIRKGYIALLCDLADRKVLGLASHKTNRDYLRDVRKRPTLFERMKGMTGSFERHWYGLRTTTQPDWEEFRENYKKAVGEI